MMLLLHVVNVHALWIYELLPNNQCGIDQHRRDFESVVWPWISAVVNVYLPLVVSVILASCLAVRTRPSYHTSTTAMDHPDVDDAQLSWVCAGVGLLNFVATSPAIAFNLLEYFLPGRDTRTGISRPRPRLV